MIYHPRRRTDCYALSCLSSQYATCGKVRTSAAAAVDAKKRAIWESHAGSYRVRSICFKLTFRAERWWCVLFNEVLPNEASCLVPVLILLNSPHVCPNLVTVVCVSLVACVHCDVQLGQPDKRQRPTGRQLAGEGIRQRTSFTVAAGSAQHYPTGVGCGASATDGLPRRQPDHVCSSLWKDHSQTIAQGTHINSSAVTVVRDHDALSSTLLCILFQWLR